MFDYQRATPIRKRRLYYQDGYSMDHFSVSKSQRYSMLFIAHWLNRGLMVPGTKQRGGGLGLGSFPMASGGFLWENLLVSVSLLFDQPPLCVGSIWAFLLVETRFVTSSICWIEIHNIQGFTWICIPFLKGESGSYGPANDRGLGFLPQVVVVSGIGLFITISVGNSSNSMGHRDTMAVSNCRWRGTCHIQKRTPKLNKSRTNPGSGGLFNRR